MSDNDILGDIEAMMSVLRKSDKRISACSHDNWHLEYDDDREAFYAVCECGLCHNPDAHPELTT